MVHFTRPESASLLHILYCFYLDIRSSDFHVIVVEIGAFFGVLNLVVNVLTFRRNVLPPTSIRVKKIKNMVTDFLSCWHIKRYVTSLSSLNNLMFNDK